MDVVKGLLVDPDVFCIVDDELEVRGNARRQSGSTSHTNARTGSCSQCRLTRTEVDTDYLAVRKLVREFDSPYARSRANINGIFRIVQRREMKIVPVRELEDVMLEIKPICFSLLIVSNGWSAVLFWAIPRHLEKCIYRPCTLVAFN